MNNNDDLSQAAKRLIERVQAAAKQVADEITVRLESADLDDLTRKAEEALGTNRPTKPEPAAQEPITDEPPAAKVSRFRDGQQVEESRPFGFDAEVPAPAFEAQVPDEETLKSIPTSDTEPQPEEDLGQRVFSLVEDIAARFNVPKDKVDNLRGQAEGAILTVKFGLGEVERRVDEVKGKLDEPTRERLDSLISQAGGVAQSARDQVKAQGGNVRAAAAEAKKREHARLLAQAEKEVARHRQDIAKAAAGLAASAALYAMLKVSDKASDTEPPQ